MTRHPGELGGTLGKSVPSIGLVRMFPEAFLTLSTVLETEARRRLKRYRENLERTGQPEYSPSGQKALKLANRARVRLKVGDAPEAIGLCRQAMETNDRVPYVYVIIREG